MSGKIPFPSHPRAKGFLLGIVLNRAKYALDKPATAFRPDQVLIKINTCQYLSAQMRFRLKNPEMLEFKPCLFAVSISSWVGVWEFSESGHTSPDNDLEIFFLQSYHSEEVILLRILFSISLMLKSNVSRNYR